MLAQDDFDELTLGQVLLARRLARGLPVAVVLPAATEEALHVVHGDEVETGVGPVERERILLVDDEPLFLTSVEDALRAELSPLEVLRAESSGCVKCRLSESRTQVVFGRGSGDEDYGSGEGNINRLKTMGFFYLTEVWEDSIMPDEEGITPQGLGAPRTSRTPTTTRRASS